MPDFSVVASDRTRSRGHKVKDNKFHLNMRENFFMSRVAEKWDRLPRKVVKSLETSQGTLPWHWDGEG